MSHATNPVCIFQHFNLIHGLHDTTIVQDYFSNQIDRLTTLLFWDEGIYCQQ